MPATIEHKIMQLIRKFAVTKNINPTAANVAYLRRFGKLCESVSKGERNAAVR